MTEFTKEERLAMLAELKGSQCFCGARKGKMKSFCQTHYYSLPDPMRLALYRRFGEGYEGAYTRAREYFKKESMA